jgi:hypothetical protein
MATYNYTITSNTETDPIERVKGGSAHVKLSGVFDGVIITPEFDFRDNLFEPTVDTSNQDMVFTVPGLRTIKPLKVQNRIRFVSTNKGDNTNVTIKVVV